jgi:hypothetical protein
MNPAARPHRLILLVLALLLAAHGAAHFVAVARMIRSMSLNVPIELFGGVVVTSSWTVAMLLALALAAAGTGFLIGARLLVGREPTVGPQLAVFASLSLVLTVVGLWATTAGVLVNLTVLTVVPGMSRLVKAQPSARSVFY